MFLKRCPPGPGTSISTSSSLNLQQSARRRAGHQRKNLVTSGMYASTHNYTRRLSQQHKRKKQEQTTRYVSYFSAIYITQGILQQIPCQGTKQERASNNLNFFTKIQPLSRKHAILYYNPELSSSTYWPPSALQPLYTNSCSSV